MIIDSPIISGSQLSSGPLNQVGNVQITGSLSVTGAINGSITGSITSASYATNAEFLDRLDSTSFVFTSSFEEYSGSVSTRETNLEATASTLTTASASFAVVSSSFATTSGSLSTRVTDVEATSSTNTQASASFAVVSASFSTTSGSLSTRVSNLEATSSTVSSSFATTSGSIAGRVTLIEGQYATTGSNTFTAPQQITDVSNAIGFTSTASLYTDGGLRVKGSAYVSGTAYFNNITVYGTSSLQYVTSSQVAIGTNIITLNTDTPSVRFGGISVFDSGSNNQSTGSLFWDSEKDRWVYANPSGSSYDGGMIISGPRNTSGLGNEQGTLSNYITKGQGGDHITSSQITDDGTTVRIPGALQVTGSLNNAVYNGSSNSKTWTVGDFSSSTNYNTLELNAYTEPRIYFNTNGGGNLVLYNSYGNAGLYFTSGAYSNNILYYTNSDKSLAIQAGGSTRMFISGSGDIGIGTTNPGAKLDISAGESVPVVRLIRTTSSGYGSQLHFSTTGSNRFAIGLNPDDNLYFDRDTTGNGGWNPTTLVIQRLTGNIGIGTASPSYALDINNNGTNIGLRINQPSSNTSYYNTIYFTGNHTSVVSYIGTGGSTTANTALRDAYYLGTYTAHPIVFTTGDTEKMRITSSGNVGIGVSNPTSNLMVYGGNSTATFVNTTSTSNVNVQLGNNVGTNIAGMALFGSSYSSNGQYRANGAYFYSNQSGGLTVHAEGSNNMYLATNGILRLNIDSAGDIFLTNTLTPLNLKPENTYATAITSLSSAASTYNYKPGVYWLNFGGQVFLGFVRFNWHQGRNWVLALKCHNTHDMPSGSPLWQNNTLINQGDFNLNNGRMAKYAAWNYFAFNRVLVEMGNRIPPIMQWSSNKTSLYSVFSAITPSNGSGLAADSTDPAMTSSPYYYDAGFLFRGPSPFPAQSGGQESIVQMYGLGSFANNSNNSTSATNTGETSGFGITGEYLGVFTGLQSVGRSGAWIGCPLDEGAHTFNNGSNSGADSGFGLGVSGGNLARTATSGVISWATGNNVINFLPAYVWLSVD